MNTTPRITRKKILAAVYIRNRRVSPATWLVLVSGKPWGRFTKGCLDESSTFWNGYSCRSFYGVWGEVRQQLEDYLDEKEGAGQ